MHRHITATLLTAFCCALTVVRAQEFPVEYTAHIQLGTGLQTRFNSSADLFFAGLYFVPQYTFIKNRLRGGAVAGAIFSEKKTDGIAGPTVSLLLRSFNASVLGTAGNLHLNLQHLWGTNGQHLAGSGLGLDLGNKVVLGLHASRDYRKGYWVFQSALGIRVAKVKEPKETFNH